MKRHIANLISAFLIIVIAMSGIPPIRAVAQGYVTIGGQVTYQPRNWDPQLNNWAIGRQIKIDLYERDLNGHDYYLDTTYTDSNGIFAFPSRLNWWSPDNRQLNVFFEIATHHPKADVTNRYFAYYVFANSPTFLSSDGTKIINFPLTSSWPNYQAVWIFEDIRNAWNYVNTNDPPYDPGYVNAIWEQGLNCYPLTLPPPLNGICSSFTYALSSPNFIFISNSQNVQDVVVHETGHMYMVNANGFYYLGCLTHSMFLAYDVNCAWSEGWANFMAMAVNNEHCWGFLSTPCQGTIDQTYWDLEAHSRTDNQQSFKWDDNVEGRVAGALYDLYDSNNEGYDRISAGFYPIAFFALGRTQITSFYDFWSNHWEFDSGQSPFLSGLTLWWNTISYINVQQIFLPTVMK